MGLTTKNQTTKNQTTKNRWFRWAYYTSWRTDRFVQPSHLRDGDSALFLAPVLAERGYEFGGVIFNPPAEPPADPIARRKVDRSFLGPNDLILVPTRPPMHDLLDGDRRYIRRSFTDLEQLVFDALGTAFSHCSRSQVTLTDAAVRGEPEVAERQNSTFHQTWGAAVDSYRAVNATRWSRPEKGKYVTITYLAYVRPAWENGPAVLATFGIGGTETLGWNYLLATRFRSLVCEVPFAMAEIVAPQPPVQPHTMDFVDSWDVKLLAPRDFNKAA